MKKAVLLIMDGLGDLPTPKTALQLAKTPNLDKLAKNGITGLIHTVGRGVVPGSDTSHLELFGYSAKHHYFGRGPLEALGIGIDLQEGDVAFRANFGTLKNGELVDRRAGRIDTQTADKISEHIQSMQIEDVVVEFRHSVEHRGVLVLRGPDLSPHVTDTDPHTLTTPHECLPTDDSPEAEKTARIVNEFVKQVNEKLADLEENKQRERKKLPPANTILLRGAGTYTQVPTIDERFRLRTACISGGALYRGVAAYIGMDIFMVPGTTGDKNTDLKAKAKAVSRALKEGYDFVFLHIKATDSFSHDGNLKGKAKFIEKIDKEVISELAKMDAYLIITGDHSTPCCRKKHSAHEVPILIHGKNERKDDVTKFDEIACMHGGIGHIHGNNLMALILDLIEKAPKFGS